MEDIKFCEHGNNNSHRCDECYIVQIESERDNLREALKIFADKENWSSQEIVGRNQNMKFSVWTYRTAIGDVRHPADIASSALTRPTQNQTEVV